MAEKRKTAQARALPGRSSRAAAAVAPKIRPSAKPAGKPKPATVNKVNSAKSMKPAAKPSAKPSAKPAAKAAAKAPVAAAKAVIKPAAKPVTKAPVEPPIKAAAKPEREAPAAKAAARPAPVAAPHPPAKAPPEPVAKPAVPAKAAAPAPAETAPKPAKRAEAAPPEARPVAPPPSAAAAPAPPPPPAPAAPVMHSGVPAGPMRPIAPPRAMAKAEIFVDGDFVVYPTHGVGKVERIAVEEIAGHTLELIHITFDENRMTLRVPTNKARTAGLRKLATRKQFDEVLATLKGRARIKRTMWSRRAQEYEAKINSGDPSSIAEVVRDLYRNAGQPDQSFSERQIYESALDRLAAEYSALEQVDKATATERLITHLKSE